MCVIIEHTEYSLQPNPTSHRGSERREREESPPSEGSRAGSLRGRKGLGCDTTRRARGPTAGLGTILTSERLKPAFRAVFPRLLAPSAPNLQRWRGWVPPPRPRRSPPDRKTEGGPGKEGGAVFPEPRTPPAVRVSSSPSAGSRRARCSAGTLGKPSLSAQSPGGISASSKQLLFPN